jgi:tetratricopeptide (TPR) repeat protein
MTEPTAPQPATTSGSDAAGAGPAACALQAANCLQRGVDAAGDERADEAVAWFRRAVALQPDLAPAHANLGLLLVALGRHREAEAPLRAALARAPAHAVLNNALGVALQALLRDAEAEPCLRAALAARPDFAEAHANLAHALRRAGQLDDAQAHYERALALQPGFVAARVGLGALLQARGELDAAIAEYQRALHSDAALVEAWNNLGNCLRQQGRLDEARDAFERVLALRPEQLEAHYNLAPLKTYRADDPHVDRFVSLQARQHEWPLATRIRYWFTAGKMLEDAGRHDDAFAAYAEGNRLKHGCTPWDEAARFELQQRVIDTFTPALIARHAPATAGDERDSGPVPVFIVGMPRSGTSLLEQVLATLPGVHGAGELTDFGETLQSAAAGHPPGAFRFPQTLADCDGDALRRLGQRYLDRLRALAPHATHVVDKLPDNFIHLGFIHLMLPNARIVHATRDPMDTCVSCYTQLFSGDNLAFSYQLDTLGRYWLHYRQMMAHWREVLPPGRVLEMPYEAMVAEPDVQARRLVAHLGLPWDERCLAFHTQRRAVKTASVAQVQRPIYRSSVARWKAFERHLAPLQALVGAAH